jgi:glycosyltransferase involved in cell wall biosynthesis
MNSNGAPLVSIVTPVYNGEPYLKACIESVLTQSYNNFEYVILNNCSSDKTLEIASGYAARDHRVTVHSNEQVLPIIANHNKAFSLINPMSRYCKVVSADDWLFPECVARMVELAERNPSIGIVGSYQLCGGDGQWYVRNHGVSYYRPVIPGPEICRLHLLGQVSVFGNPTSTLYRSDLVRSTTDFYPNATAEADRSACFQALLHSDYGFIQQVLSYERLHSNRTTTTSQTKNAYLSSAISDCVIYGKSVLTETELEQRIAALLNEYYLYLASCAFRKQDHGFWQYHRVRLEEIGFPFDKKRLFTVIALKVARLSLDPVRLIRILTERLPNNHRRRSERLLTGSV